MARVFWDGEKIVATACNANIERLSQLAEKYNAEALPAVNGYAFTRTVQTIKDISTLNQTAFDSSFEELLNKVNKADRNKQEYIDSFGFPEEMYPFQKETAATVIKWEHNALIAGDMGTGKSCMASVIVDKLEGALPAVVVCQATLKINWEVEIHKWAPRLKTYVINGRSSWQESYVVEKAKEADIIIINYDILGVDDKEKQEKEKKRIKIAKEEGRKYRKAFIPIIGWVDKINEVIKPNVVICDECQCIQNLNAIRTRGVIQITRENGILKLFLSGTPFETRVQQFYTSCHIMAPDLFPSEWEYKQQYCGPWWDGYHWQYKGVTNLDELRRKLATFMIRLRKEDVLPQLPKKQKIPIYLDMDKKSRQAYDKMEDELSVLEGLHQFSYLAKMKKVLMEIKLEPAVQFIKDMLEVEDKLVLFTYHTEMYDTLMNSFGNSCVGINGSVPPFKRQDCVNKFQKDNNIKLFIGQIQAASTGITLTASHIVIFIEWGKTVGQMRQATDRICRIGQTADRCLVYYLIIKDTIDEDPLETLTKHGDDIDMVLDGEVKDSLLSENDIDNMMIAKVKSRRLMRNKETVQIEYE